jgi:hypothetical protein
MEEVKFKELKFRKLNKGIETAGAKQEVFAAKAGDYTVFHVKGVLNGSMRKTYILRKGKKQVLNEVPRDLFMENLKAEGLGIFRSEGKIIISKLK